MRRGRTTDIGLGAPLRHALYDSRGHLLLRTGQLIETRQQFERLLEQGFLVDDDDAPGHAAWSGPAASPAGEPLVPVEAEPEPVFDAVREIARRLQLLHDHLLARTTSRFAPSLLRMVAELDGLATDDADAALASMHLYSTEEGLGPRLVHAAVLCHVFATALGMDAAQRRSTLAAALTYDVALTPIATTLNRQTGPLTAAQRQAVDSHPAEACELLQAAGIDDPLWLDAVMEHHERVDGSGYPRRLEGDVISLPGRVLGIVDSFSAMVRPRAYREAVLSRQALRDIFLQRSKSVDERLAHVFVKEIGMYPPGSLVRLANGETALVVRRGAQATHPEVRVVMYADGSRALTHPARDTHEAGMEIVEGVQVHRHRALLASVHELWRAA